jgi:hypothetical protein
MTVTSELVKKENRAYVLQGQSVNLKLVSSCKISFHSFPYALKLILCTYLLGHRHTL